MAGHIGAGMVGVANGSERKQTYAITQTTTNLTGLAYTPSKVHVFHNGIRLVDGTDYTATNGTSITLTTAAEDGDEVVVISNAGFQVSDTVSAANGGTFAGNVAMSGTLDVTGATTLSSDLNVGTIKDTTGTNTAMNVTADGAVTRPNQPFGYAVGTVQSTGVFSANTYINFLQSNIIQGGMAFSNGGRWTVPVAGIYLVSVSFYIYENSGDTEHVALNLHKNGTQYAPLQWEYNGITHAGRRDHSLNTTWFVPCAANDYLEVMINCDAGQTVDIFQGVGNNYFGVYLLG